MVDEDHLQGVAQKGPRADDVGVAAAGPVLSPAGVLAPVQFVLDVPLAPDEREPLVFGAFPGLKAGDEEAALRAAGVAFRAAPGLDADEGPCEREAYGVGLGGPDNEAAAFEPAVPALPPGKGGASPLKASSAAFSSEGWLSLIRSR